MLRNTAKWLGVALLLTTAVGAVAPLGVAQVAQPGPGAGRIYNPATVTTVQGTITGIVSPVPTQAGGGVHLTLDTTQGTVDVRLGPSWFISSLQLNLAVGDSVSVTGSRVSQGGTPIIVAASITKGNRTVTLRDATGRPVWAGRGPGW